jgi:lipoprotein
MKKLIIISAIFSIVTLGSCTNEEPAIDNVHTDITNQTSDISSFECFMVSVDSVNTKYVGDSSRGFLSSIAKTAADKGGRLAGQFAGRWIGGSIGAAAGNPATACIGYLAGQKVGGIVGYALASAIADMMMSEYAIRTNTIQDLELKADYNIKPSEMISLKSRSAEDDLQCDSIGYYHNYVMVQVSKNRQRYYIDGSLDINLLYDDIIKFFKEVGVYSEFYADNKDIKRELLERVNQLALISYQCDKKSTTNEELVNLHCQYLKEKCLLTDEELRVHRDLTLSIANTCTRLSENEIHAYATELNNVIKESDLSQEAKIEVAVSASTTINCALCWQQ